MSGANGIAIIGYSYRLPQEVDNDTSLWEALDSQRNLRAEWPESRINAGSFVKDSPTNIPAQGAHLLNEDLGAFDAPFFSVTAQEAASMDPMQRWTLEESYPGIPVETLKGSKTAVFSASMLEDKSRMTAMDPENVDRTVATGSTVPCVIPNRVSWYFDLRGPSIHVNTACSSSMSAIDMACKVLHSGDASCALVTASNLCLDPSIFQILTRGGFLSPDGLSYSFDHRANGYARGEGILAFVLKPISGAVQNGDMIRAIIRSTGSNQDGHSPALTQPSPQAQEDLIRHVYRQANLPFHETRYVEAHGTGTPVGDPIEIKAIGRVFRKLRSSKCPLYVGSIKANIGHLEGASGLASLVKAILILEKGIIPPSALLEVVNPAIDAEFFNIEIPNQRITWPSSGVRRVSVNSFGFGGSNTHVILDDALSYLQQYGLAGNHCTAMHPGGATEVRQTAEVQNGITTSDMHLNGNEQVNGTGNGDPMLRPVEMPAVQASQQQLLVWTASDKRAAERMANNYKAFFASSVLDDKAGLHQLSFTLGNRRSRMLWRGFAVTQVTEDGQLEKTISPIKPVRSSIEAGLAFVFTGQGAQYLGMGLELIQYPVFTQTLSKINQHFSDLGCAWSVFDELHNPDHINLPEYSQPLATALQIALVELLKSFGIVPKAVVGHSSGEIAAAYSIGALSLSSACKVAYFRGKLTGKLQQASAESPGAMLSINLAKKDVTKYLQKLQSEALEQITIACLNSPVNCTLSGSDRVINAIKLQADVDGIFAQKLNTGVAYHSPAMKAISDEYHACIGTLESVDLCERSKSILPPMVSSVSGQAVRPAALAMAQYWVDNLVSPVHFTDAVQVLLQNSSTLKVGLGSITDIVEIGPHPALRRPVNDTINQPDNQKKGFGYFSVLHRSQKAVQSTLELAGHLFCLGHEVSIAAINQHSVDSQPPFLVSCPPYPFDRSNHYWKESRISRDFRLRNAVDGELLGAPVSDWNPFEPCWRNFLAVESTPWLGQHLITNTVLFPASGILLLALEAARQMVPSKYHIRGYFVKEIEFTSPIIVPERWEDRTETQVRLRPVKTESHTNPVFDIAVFSYYRDRWTSCSNAIVQVEIDDTPPNTQAANLPADDEVDTLFKDSQQACTRSLDSQIIYNSAAESGLRYGEMFRRLQDMWWDGKSRFMARMDVRNGTFQTSSLVHPAVLDNVFQVLVLSGGHEKIARVPVRLTNAWFASSGWQRPETTLIQCLGKSHTRLNNSPILSHQDEASAYAVTDNGRVLCHIKRATLATVAREGKEQRHLIHHVEWKPQVCLLEPSHLKSLIPHEVSIDESLLARNLAKMRSALGMATVHSLHHWEEASLSDHLRLHLKWLEKRVHKLQPAERMKWQEMSESQVEAELIEVDNLLPDWKVYTICARKLPQILEGKEDPLELIFNSDLAGIFYASLFKTLCADGRLSRLLDLMAHENPAMRILEVGAGTGGMTGHILSALRERESRTGSLSFSEYAYTDMSPMFFEGHARAGLTWRLKDGFSGSVLHATTDLEAAIRNVRQALKPGGHLILLETTSPDDILTSFFAGLLPGWWSDRESWRSECPAIADTMWDQCLRNNGFSGNDLVVRDHLHSDCQLMSIILTTAVEETSSVDKSLSRTGNVSLLVDDQQPDQLEIAQQIKQSLSDHMALKVDIASFFDVESHQALESFNSNDIYVSLAEVHQPLLARLSESGFDALRHLTKNAANLVWVTAYRPDDPRKPEYDVAHGFFRTLRGEQPSHHFVHISIECENDFGRSVSCMEKVLEASFFRSPPSTELEYVMRDGLLMTGRAVENADVNNALHHRLSPNLQKVPWAEAGPVELSVTGAESDFSVRFVQDVSHESPLEENEIEIEAHCWGFNRIDTRTNILTDSCAGIVTHLGSSCDGSIRLGDRVYMFTNAPLRKYSRAEEAAVVRIPDSVSFETAISTISPIITANYVLIDIAGIGEGDRVLIHSAASDLGQSAVRLAQERGARVFATTASAEHTDFLIKDLGLCADKIVSNLSPHFASEVLRVTGGSGVDVVLSSLTDHDVLQASCESLAPGGQFLEIRQNSNPDLTLPLGRMAKNTTFSVVDLQHIPSALKRLLRETVMSLLFREIQPRQPMVKSRLSKLEDTIKQSRDAGFPGRTVVSAASEDIIPQFIQASSTWKFDSSASYLVAGGFGGLGIVVIEWMVERGAQYLIIPSRSGAKSQKAKNTVERLTAQGVHIISPECDASSEASLSRLLEECSQNMPPIKGCINAAMVLQDGIFQENMTFNKWEYTLKSKVATSWNLHRLLPKDLDFFILLSSLAAPVGMIASSNYAGGCSFQDSLARYRVNQCQHALSIDIGWMRNIGIIAENEAYQRQRLEAGDFLPIEGSELLALLDIYCDPSNLQQSPAESQVLLGISRPSDHLARGAALPVLLEAPLFLAYSYVPNSAVGNSSASAPDHGVQFRQATDSSERVQIVLAAISAKLARSMSITSEDVEPRKQLSSYGLDSLMAVNIRNWILAEFGATLSVFDIMGGASIAAVADMVVAKSTL
ncbi:Acyl transferase/acyl hydrolase/lysophospholipase [Penicillium alfredii]|uniref:Acyl transferase/acyl hydrolase/lysophospholipase n=1 Tax=Penicillium alfredii TaxID=1506179 RepID=A0A9W9FLK7_9EURO|nr:Acyl transferase/acyl hydrolase/lysophospholipase [Penicillium alfredii]KAJ5102441.1 Acyl transferase/acyl hydrolase/lysophospholipase [Penicillium alfredii]